MVTGRRAFGRETAVETLTAVIRDEPEPIGRYAPDAPAPLQWIIERCLKKDPRSATPRRGTWRGTWRRFETE
jgi:hypothetical protein